MEKKLGLLDGGGARRGRRRVGPTLACSVRQVDFVICLYTTLPVHGEVWWSLTHEPAAEARLARAPRSTPDVESLRHFTAIFVMNIDLLRLWYAAQTLTL